MNCCGCHVDEVFTAKRLRKDAKRYRKQGLDERARMLMRAIMDATPLYGKSLLEVGAGTACITIEFLQRGLPRATAVDAAPAAVLTARTLADEKGVSDRLTVQLADFAAEPTRFGHHDLVVMDRVVCCFPGGRELVEAAADAARAVVALSYPKDAWYTRAAFMVLNAGQALLRRQFRLFVHSPGMMQDVLRDRGWTPQVVGSIGMWELVVATKG